MSWSRIQGKTLPAVPGSGTGASVSFDAAVSSGNIVLGVCWAQNATSFSGVTVTDDKSNTYDIVDQSTAGGWPLVSFKSHSVITNGPTTITISGITGSGIVWPIIEEFSPPGSVVSVDAHTINTTDISSLNVTTTHDGCLVWSGVVVNGTVHGAGTGFTIGVNGSPSQYTFTEYAVQSTHGSINPAWPASGTGGDVYSSNGGVTIALSSASAFTLSPDHGAYTLAGENVTLTPHPQRPVLTATSGTYSLTGEAITLPFSTLDPFWWTRYQYGGNLPTAVIDFENGLYWDVLNSGGTVASFLNNAPSVTPGSGIKITTTNVTAKSSLLNAFGSGAYSVQVVTVGATASATEGIVSDQVPNGIVMASNGGMLTYNNSTGGLNDSAVPDWSKHVRASVSNTPSSIRRISSVAPNTDAAGEHGADTNGYPTPTTITIGSWNGGNNFDGYIAQLAVSKAMFPDQVIGPEAFTGVNGWWWNADSVNSYISFGNILQYEYTQPWTVIAAINLLHYPNNGTSGVTGIIFTTVPSHLAGSFPGYELWVNGSGLLHSRILSEVSGFIGKYGTTNLADGKWHVVAATYDGSGLASGLNLYVDGVLETMTTESDNLGGHSIKGTNPTYPNNYLIGNQTDENFGFPGAIGLFRQFNVVKVLSDIQAYAVNQRIPALDSSCVFAPSLQEGSGASGTNVTTSDLSGNGLTGTLSDAAQWLRGKSPKLILASGGRYSISALAQTLGHG
jgi:Concanavalin A-like lectin/glucanases superfamily